MNTPDLTFYHLIHKSMRESSRRLTVAVGGLNEDERLDRGRQLVRWYKGFEGELHIHHTVEDNIFFPGLFVHVPALRGYLDRIDEEHAYLTELITETGNAMNDIANPMIPFADAVAKAETLAASLEALLERHLDFEDAEVLPLFTRHMDADEYTVLEKRAMKDGDLSQMKFTVPWIMSRATPEEQDGLLDSAPFVLRLLWMATRRGYARLEQESLGADVPAASQLAAAS